MTFVQEGAVVRLKSGGPEMTVHHIGDNHMAYCQWFLDNGELKTHHFNPLALIVLDDDQDK